MGQGAFAPDVRLYRCDHCGAPLDVPLEGGQVTCGFCAARHLVSPRVARPPAAESMAAPFEFPFPKGAAEDPRSPFPPEVRRAFERQAGARTTLEAAEQWWREVRAALKVGDRASEAWAYLVADKLWGWYVGRRDRRRARALLESLLDQLETPELKDLARLSLAREAARCGEVENAEAWLAQCEERPAILDVSSQRRITEAVIAQQKGDWAGMLRALGERGAATTFAAWLVPLSAVLRAHALECSGRGEEAFREIWAAQRLHPGTVDVLRFQALTHRVAPQTLARLRAWQRRARLQVALALGAALLAGTLTLWLSRTGTSP